MPAEPIVVDATVLRRFALADRIHELPAALGGPAAVCRAVWDPDEEPGICDQGRSELTRSIAVQHHRYQDGRRTAQDRAAARHLCQQLATVRSLHDSGGLLVIDLDDPEAQLCAELVSRHRASAFGLTFPLAPSAAGSVAVAATRSWRLASDDQDAHTALRSLTGPHLVVTSSELLPSGTTPHRTKKKEDRCRPRNSRRLGRGNPRRSWQSRLQTTECSGPSHWSEQHQWRCRPPST